MEQDHEESRGRERLAEERAPRRRASARPGVVDQGEGEAALEEGHEGAHVELAAAERLDVVQPRRPNPARPGRSSRRSPDRGPALAARGAQEHAGLEEALVLPGQHAGGAPAVALAARCAQPGRRAGRGTARGEARARTRRQPRAQEPGRPALRGPESRRAASGAGGRRGRPERRAAMRSVGARFWNRICWASTKKTPAKARRAMPSSPQARGEEQERPEGERPLRPIGDDAHARAVLGVALGDHVGHLGHPRGVDGEGGTKSRTTSGSESSPDPGSEPSTAEATRTR